MKGDFLGFSFDGIHCSKLGITHVSSSDRYDEDLFPEVKDKTIEIPNNHGEYYYGSTYGTRTFEIEIAYDSITEKQFRDIRRLFGTRKVCELIFDERPYKVYYAKIENPIEMSYVCFDEQKKHVGETIQNGGIRYVEENGELVKEDITPWVYEFDNNGNPIKERIYKGEGNINLICYQPFAHQLFKIKELYERAGTNQGDLITTYTNVDEWIESSGILTEEQWNLYKIDQTVSIVAPVISTVTASSEGLEVSVDNDIFQSVYTDNKDYEFIYNESTWYYVEDGVQSEVNLEECGITIGSLGSAEVIGFTITNAAAEIPYTYAIPVYNPGDLDVGFCLYIPFNNGKILPQEENSDIIINGDTELLVLKPIERKDIHDTGVLINTRTHLIEGVNFSQIANEHDYRKPAWQTTGTLYNEYIKIGEFPYIKRNDWALDTVDNRPQTIYISCAEVEGIRIHYDYLYF